MIILLKSWYFGPSKALHPGAPVIISFDAPYGEEASFEIDETVEYFLWESGKSKWKSLIALWRVMDCLYIYLQLEVDEWTDKRNSS